MRVVLLIVDMVPLSLQAKDEQSAMEEKYRNELNANVKLCSLYKVRRQQATWDQYILFNLEKKEKERH